MSRSRKSAKQAGATFEREIANSLSEHVSEFIDRKVRTGAKDQGDVANLRSAHDLKVTVEAKNYGGRFEVGAWLKEAEEERQNAGDDLGIVIAKRRGTTDPLDQVCFMDVRTLIGLVTGDRPTFTEKKAQP